MSNFLFQSNIPKYSYNNNTIGITTRITSTIKINPTLPKFQTKIDFTSVKKLL